MNEVQIVVTMQALNRKGGSQLGFSGLLIG